MNRVLVLAAAVLAAHQTGCASARYVSRGEDGGVIAVPDRSNSWPSYNNDKAVALIKEHVGPDYEIVEEWAEKSGTPPPSAGHAPKDPSTNTPLYFMPNEPRPRATAANDQDQASELRIRYRRRASGASAWLPPAGSKSQMANAAPGANRPPSDIIPAAYQASAVKPLVMPAAATAPAPSPTNPAWTLPPPILPAVATSPATR